MYVQRAGPRRAGWHGLLSVVGAQVVVVEVVVRVAVVVGDGDGQ